MTSDYNRIAEDHERLYGTDKKARRIYKELYSEKTHFLNELIQNAEDSDSQCLELQLYENGLLVWNDGSQFSNEDVIKICSLYSSNKDLTQIGSFGIGFKAVYNYTERPEIYSGTEQFLIEDLIRPEYIPKSNMKSRVAELVENGKTVFRLPFKEDLHEEDVNQLEKRLRELNVQTLLFLRNLKKIHWSDERKKQNGTYRCNRQSHDIMQNAEKVELTESFNGTNKTTETFLVFRKEIYPPKDVINQLIHQEEYPEDKKRIERSAEKLQPVEIAFKIQDERIIEMDSCVLFAYLPTKMKTNLRFLIQARYQTTPARDNISTNSPWNEWLMKETAEFLPDVLEELKAGGLLTPTFFNVIPLQNDKVPIEYEAISKSLQKAMQNHPFIPTHNDGYAKAECVRYPHAESLYQLIESEWMKRIEWLNPEIRNIKEFSRCFMAMREAGVKEALCDPILKWLKERPQDWFEERANDWLHSLYLYLDKQKSKMKRIKELPLVRLEDGSHICASKKLVFFPPNTSDEREGIAPFINELPIVQSTLLKENAGNDIKSFLKNIGVKTLQLAHLISEYILPKYLESDKERTEEQNRVHIHYLQTIWSKKPAQLNKLKAKISDTTILLAYRTGDRKSLSLKKPCQVYLSQTYTGNADLETYFSGQDDVWYVDDGYLESNSDPKKWCSFLKEIGVLHIPRVIKNNGDSYFDGLQEVLGKINSDKNKTLSIALWHLLIKAQSSFDVVSCSYLKETAWIPDKHGDIYCPSECFDPTDENRNVLGNSVVYLHPDFDINEDNKDARSLAERLGINLSANTDCVLNYLQILSGTAVEIENIKPLYLFIYKEIYKENTSLSDVFNVFKEEHLIYAPNPETDWWRSDEVFWEDESVVFGNNRGYLGAYYPEELKPFFIALGVSERAAPLNYVRSIQDIASIGKVDECEVRERIKVLYSRLWQFLKEGGSSLEHEEWQEKWEEIRASKCWFGKKGDEWEFFLLETLVWSDDTYVAKIFDGTIPFWGLGDDLLDFAEELGIERCSQAKVKFNPIGEQKEDSDWTEKVQNLHPYIHDFLKSPDFCIKEDKSVDFLKTLSVGLVEELGTTYTLKSISLPSTDPRPSFLDVSDQKVTLWLVMQAEKDDYALLIGDAIEDYFGVKDLSRFIEHLLTKEIHKVLDRWKREGLRPELCERPQKLETKANQENSHIPEKRKVPGSTDENDTDRKSDGDSLNGSSQIIYKHEGDLKRKISKINGDVTYPPPPSSKKGSVNKIDMPESLEHQELKENLAKNPTQLGVGLNLVEIEYEFKSNDRVDILFEDSFGNPVPVEVEIAFFTDQKEIGVWQAAKYKHLAAAEYDLPCHQVRSILVAPKIPDDIIEKCKELGIEPIEVTMPD